jgi:hypothetical protein
MNLHLRARHAEVKKNILVQKTQRKIAGQVLQFHKTIKEE